MIKKLLSFSLQLSILCTSSCVLQNQEPQMINGFIVDKDTTDLKRAIIYKNIEEITELLEDGENPNEQKGTPPLELAISVSDGDMQTINALLKAGARVTDQAFKQAVIKGYPQYLRAFLEAGAKIPAADSYSGNIFNHISFHSKEPIACAELLLAAGANVSEMANEDKNITPLHKITQDGHPDMVVFFVKNGVNINAQDAQGKTALMNEFCEHPEIIRALLKAGANPNIRNNKGENAVMYFITHEYPTGGIEKTADGGVLCWDGSAINKKALQEIIAGGGNVNMKDKEGKRPLERCNDPEICDMLIKAGAK